MVSMLEKHIFIPSPSHIGILLYSVVLQLISSHVEGRALGIKPSG